MHGVKGRRRRVAIVALLAMLTVTVGGLGIASAVTSAPTAIATCTKVSNGKTKIVVSTSSCPAGKTIAKNWIDARYAKYQTLLTCWTGAAGTCVGKNFSGLDLTNIQLAGAWSGNFDLSGANFSGAKFNNTLLLSTPATGANFNGASFKNSWLGVSGAGMTAVGATWVNTICPDATNSDSNGNTCIGHGF